MPYHAGFPDDLFVREIAEMLDRSRSVAEIWDAELRQVFVTREYLRAVGVASMEQLGTLGLEVFDAEMFAARARWPWPAGSIEELSAWYAMYGGLFVRQVGIGRIRAVAPPELAAAFAAADPQREWGMCELVATQQVGEVILPLRATVTVIYGIGGDLRCIVSVVGPAVSGHVLAMLAVGDAGNFERLTHLIQPDVRPAAILFVDVEASTRIARELPTRGYFHLIARFVSMFDACAVRHAGVVGKHAGDGASAFVLVQECGSPSRAAAAAIRTAREAAAGFADVAADAGFARETLRLNAAVHWGERVVVGNLVSAARLEATAFGEEVNEAARVENVANGGALLATKALIERLDDTDAAALEIDPHVGAYTLLGDLPGASEKTRRDAGSLPVRAHAM
jgi:class 3 adenylate cyclase